MRTTAILIALTMLTTGLAGCTGDPDGGGNDEIDSDALQDLFDEHFEDFINNTTITVNNHYHNNTTYVTNENHNITTNEGDDVSENNYNQYNGSGAGSGSVMQMFTVEWSPMGVLGYDPGDTMVINGWPDPSNSSNGSSGDNTLLFARSYNGHVIEFRVTCEEFFNYERYTESTWRQYLDDNYGYNDNEIYDAANWIHDQFQNAYHGYGIDAYEQCGLNEEYDEGFHVLYEINLQVGQAMNFLVNGNYVTVDINCDDGYGTGLGNGTSTVYIGGQANCTITGSSRIMWEFHMTGYVYDENGNISQYNGQELYEYGADFYYLAPESFAVYFMMHYVEVYDLDSE